MVGVYHVSKRLKISSLLLIGFVEGECVGVRCDSSLLADFGIQVWPPVAVLCESLVFVLLPVTENL